MSKLYDESHRVLQRRFDSERLADRIEQKLYRERLSAEDRAFIQSVDMFFLATVDAAGRPSCSYKGGDAGFVRVLDDRTLAFPSFDGNGMFLSAGNIAGNSHVGLLFIDFEQPKRLRVNGSARLAEAAQFEPPFHGADLVVVVDVRDAFPNCSRYIHKKRTIAASPFVPHEGTPAPTPDWKRSDWAHDVLPSTTATVLDDQITIGKEDHEPT